MHDKPCVCIHVYHRDRLPVGKENHKKYGNGIYHWAIWVCPKSADALDQTTTFDATDGLRVTPEGKTINPDLSRWYRLRKHEDPTRNPKFLTAIYIGKLPKSITVDNVEKMLGTMPLPRKTHVPRESFVSWARNAILRLQKEGCVDRF
ncbi:hypothetical protein K470DRAFT_210414 [Piedraia hortae CBS 480.64]|uniref:Uncharacterized protein n=1 Tax=Piedraia hortae CBS 480.64 TaxID=1314780 RepID=A0A6A7C7F0_9PEZI|nr:hypothetical protein K470DRAFT_210414 [Piedraia hortae CBS 480.64]